ncbi:MAG: hypothetical protein ACRDGD_05545 [Candidatus Limnocylindria bacterium]
MLSRAIAAAILFMAAATTIAFALTGSGGPIALTVTNLAMAALGVVLAAAAIEALRARHYWFTLLVPAGMALFSLGYALASGVYQAIVTVVMYAVAALLIAQSRADFDHRAHDEAFGAPPGTGAAEPS